jgi:hypothetical protein
MKRRGSQNSLQKILFALKSVFLKQLKARTSSPPSLFRGHQKSALPLINPFSKSPVHEHNIHSCATTSIVYSAPLDILLLQLTQNEGCCQLLLPLYACAIETRTTYFVLCCSTCSTVIPIPSQPFLLRGPKKMHTTDACRRRKEVRSCRYKGGLFSILHFTLLLTSLPLFLAFFFFFLSSPSFFRSCVILLYCIPSIGRKTRTSYKRTVCSSCLYGILVALSQILSFVFFSLISWFS